MAEPAGVRLERPAGVLLQCPHCDGRDAAFGRIESLKEHIAMVHYPGATFFECRQCKMKFFSEVILYSHLRICCPDTFSYRIRPRAPRSLFHPLMNIEADLMTAVTNATKTGTATRDGFSQTDKIGGFQDGFSQTDKVGRLQDGFSQADKIKVASMGAQTKQGGFKFNNAFTQTMRSLRTFGTSPIHIDPMLDEANENTRATQAVSMGDNGEALQEAVANERVSEYKLIPVDDVEGFVKPVIIMYRKKDRTLTEVMPDSYKKKAPAKRDENGPHGATKSSSTSVRNAGTQKAPIDNNGQRMGRRDSDAENCGSKKVDEPLAKRVKLSPINSLGADVANSVHFQETVSQVSSNVDANKEALISDGDRMVENKGAVQGDAAEKLLKASIICSTDGVCDKLVNSSTTSSAGDVQSEIGVNEENVGLLSSSQQLVDLVDSIGEERPVEFGSKSPQQLLDLKDNSGEGKTVELNSKSSQQLVDSVDGSGEKKSMDLHSKSPQQLVDPVDSTSQRKPVELNSDASVNPLTKGAETSEVTEGDVVESDDAFEDITLADLADMSLVSSCSSPESSRAPSPTTTPFDLVISDVANEIDSYTDSHAEPAARIWSPSPPPEQIRQQRQGERAEHVRESGCSRERSSRSRPSSSGRVTRSGWHPYEQNVEQRKQNTGRRYTQESCQGTRESRQLTRENRLEARKSRRETRQSRREARDQENQRGRFYPEQNSGGRSYERQNTRGYLRMTRESPERSEQRRLRSDDDRETRGSRYQRRRDRDFV